MSIVMALAATLMLAGPGHATPQATAPHAAAGTPTVHPAQADATRNWTRRTARGVVLWLPEAFTLVHADAGSDIFSTAPSPRPGALVLAVMDDPDTHARYMGILADAPPDAPTVRSTRDIGALGSFESVTFDLRDTPGSQALLSVLLAPEADARGRRILITALALAPRDDNAWDWDETRTLFEDILDRITDSNG